MSTNFPYANPPAIDPATDWWPETPRVSPRTVPRPDSPTWIETDNEANAELQSRVESLQPLPILESISENTFTKDGASRDVRPVSITQPVDAAYAQIRTNQAQTMGPTLSQGVTAESSLPAEGDSASITIETVDSDAVLSPRVRNIDDCIKDLLVMPKHDMQRLDCSDGDTWIFIRAPGREPEYTDAVYRAICEYYKTPLRASSSVLEASQSELILDQLKNPTKQFRIIRRSGVKGEMQKHNIRYVLDLTPPVEGDDAVELTQELSCPLGVLNWFHESCAFSVSNNMVAGAEEFTPDAVNKPSVDSQARPDVSSMGPTAMYDYTPLRHRAAIERVLLALHGHDPRLNSAPKMYTTVMTAVRHLKIPAYCLSSNLTDYVVTWLRAVPNNAFIELHPDVTLKIADYLQVAHLCQDAFAILVGEAALGLVSQYNMALPRETDRSIHNRLIAPVDEMWETRLQYARNAFAERVNDLFFNQLVGPRMEWVERLPCVPAIKKNASEEYIMMHHDFLQQLKEFVRGGVYCVLLGKYTRLPVAKEWTKEDKEIAARMTIIFNKLRSKERIFTRNFWMSLSRMEFNHDEHSFNTAVIRGLDCAFSSQGREYSELRSAGIFKEVTGLSIVRRVWEMKEIEKPTMPEDMASTKSLVPELPISDFLRRFAPGVLMTDAESPRKRPRSSGNPGPNDELPIRQAPNAVQLPGHLDNGEIVSNSTENRQIIAEIIDGWSTKNARGTSYHTLEEDVTLSDFNFSTFCGNVHRFLADFAYKMLNQPNLEGLDQCQTDLLLCLTDNETKYLPLWAGGWDDGSNGVFGEEAPAIPEEEGFGPARDGLRRNISGDEMDFDGASTTLGAPTLATSRMVNDGHSVIMDRRQVYADDEVESVRHDNTASEDGTEDSWTEAGSVSTTGELARDFSRTALSPSVISAEVASVGVSDADDAEEATLHSDSESALDLESNHEFDFEDASEVSDFEFMDAPQSSNAGGTAKKRKSAQFDEDNVALWLNSESNGEASTIRYRDVPKSPLIFNGD